MGRHGGVWTFDGPARPGYGHGMGWSKKGQEWDRSGMEKRKEGQDRNWGGGKGRMGARREGTSANGEGMGAAMAPTPIFFRRHGKSS